MNTMMLALLQGRLWDKASTLQHRLLRQQAGQGESSDDSAAGELALVHRALDALHTGHYGFCHDCGQPLEPDELLVKPYRLQCERCESSIERGRRRTSHNQ
jgi:RNA polymerase-binding transcription factor DksA